MLVYLKPESSLPRLSSDTIFGALIYGFSQLYPDEVDDIVDLFTEEPPFLISSSFPYIEGDERLRFYPRLITEPEAMTPSASRSTREPHIYLRKSSSNGPPGKYVRRT